ncbi:MAG: hypothetical protein ABI361_08375 [Nitrososphaera sp.]|jgi:hypothetical protein
MGKPTTTKPIITGARKQPGFCIKCAAPATVEAHFKESGVVIVERYCDKCIVNASR